MNRYLNNFLLPMAFAHFAEEMEKNLWRSFAPRQLSASLQRKWLSSENLI